MPVSGHPSTHPSSGHPSPMSSCPWLLFCWAWATCLGKSLAPALQVAIWARRPGSWNDCVVEKLGCHSFHADGPSWPHRLCGPQREGLPRGGAEWAPLARPKGDNGQGSSATQSVFYRQVISRWTCEPQKWCPRFPRPGPHSRAWSPVLHWSDPTSKQGHNTLAPSHRRTWNRRLPPWIRSNPGSGTEDEPFPPSGPRTGEGRGAGTQDKRVLLRRMI